ncbi:MAG: RcnB family protein [Proteobacteria bacterium]|nr:RcnB family protein [Pseudomonadota bacterium]
MKKTLLASVAALALAAAAPAFADEHNHGDDHGSAAGDHHDGSSGRGPAGGDHGAAGGHGPAGGGHMGGPAGGPAGGPTGSPAGGPTGGGHMGGPTGGPSGGPTGGGHMGSPTGGPAGGPTGGGHMGGPTGGPGGGAPGGAHPGGDNHGAMPGGHDNHGGTPAMGGGDHRGSGAPGVNRNPTIIFGTGGHGYRDKGHFGRSSHNPDFKRFNRNYKAPKRFHHGTYHKPHGWYYRRWTFGDFLPSLFFGEQYWLDSWSDYGLPYPPPGCVWVRYGNDALLVDEDTGEIIQVVYGVFY